MNKQDYERAQHLRMRIDNLNQQATELEAALLEVKSHPGNRSNADKLVGLFLELAKTVEGKQAMEAIVDDVLWKIKEQKKELEKEFEAI